MKSHKSVARFALLREKIGNVGMGVALDLESGTPSEAYREGLDWDD